MTTNKNNLDKTDAVKIQFNSQLARVISRIENYPGVCLPPLQDKEKKVRLMHTKSKEGDPIHEGRIVLPIIR